MKKQLGKILFSGALLIASAPLLAQYQDDHGRGDQDHGDQGHGDQGHGQGPGGQYHGGGDHGRRQGHGGGMYDRGRQEGWYRRGGRVPEDYRGGRYEVTDWRRDRLREPPRGYRWVRSDNGDFLLIAVTTGIIADILSQQ